MLEPARLAFAPDGTPWSAAYGDVYHSAHGGLAQARHVFLGGNELPRRWQGRDRFVILETGFGLGLNFLATWQAWQADPARCHRLHFVSFEKHPFAASDLAQAHAAWPELAGLSAALRRRWPPLVPGMHRVFLDDARVVLTLIFGDACDELRRVDLAADAFYLDGFSPARNPELWTPEVCRALARVAAPAATLATWSVAGHLRAALDDAEFDLERRPGFAGKRQMLSGRFRSRRPARFTPPDDRTALVIGAGIAGSTAALRLADAGWQVDVLETRAAPADGASGNLAGVLRPVPSADDNRLSRLSRAGFIATRALLADLPGARWSACGVLHLARDPAHEAQQARAIAALGLPDDFQQYLDAAAASERLGRPVDAGGWWFPQGGWVQPPSVCRAALAARPDRVRLHTGMAVARLEPAGDRWRALADDGRVIGEAAQVVMASGVAATGFAQYAWLPQKSARGQVSHLPAAGLPRLDVVLCRHGYTAPPVDGLQLAGATLSMDDPDSSEREADHAFNLARLNRSLPGFAPDIAPSGLRGRVGFRPMAPDRLPIVGALPRWPAVAGRPPRASQWPAVPGLWCALGFGARGIVWSALMADLLASRMSGEPLPLPADLIGAVSPGRFLDAQTASAGT